MKIVALSGSPKGENSVTLQSFNYIAKNFPEHEHKIIHIGSAIQRIESDAAYFQSIIQEVKSADAVMWVTPVFYLLVPYQLKRFIELIFERGASSAFEGKYATTLTTSVHFFDHTAHNYLNGICDDLKMPYIEGFSADMQDFMIPKERKNLLNFAHIFFDAVKNKTATLTKFPTVSYNIPKYLPTNVKPATKEGNHKIVVVTDATAEDSNLIQMVEVFKETAEIPVEIVNLNEIETKGGCLSCYVCAYENLCVYKDGFNNVFQNTILKGDAIIFASKIKDRFLSSTWKKAIDRTFFLGHTPQLKGKQMGFIVSGALKQLPNVSELLKGLSEAEMSSFAGIISDDCESSDTLTKAIEGFAKQVSWSIKNDFKRPPTFLGVAGHKLFRDFVYDTRPLFRADHLFYKKNKLYDYPYKDIKKRIANVFFSLPLKIPPIRSWFFKNITKEMLRPYEKVSVKENQ